MAPHAKTVWNAGDVISALKLNNGEAQYDDVCSPGTVLNAPEFKNYMTTVQTVLISSGVLTVDLSLGCEVIVNLNANITSIVFLNYPTATKVTTVTFWFYGDGAVRTITWPASFHWTDAAAPPMTGTLNKVDMITARTRNGGTSWFPALYGRNMSA
jgi:hypothetical protein